MKEAFWGVLILMLGLFGIVVVNLFQKVTINNDQVYYVIKESTEASMYDAIDLTKYRLTGRLRIVEDKFVENLTRRFAESITRGNYTITVHDVNENPPKVSVTVRSGISSLQGETFTITNRVDGILETKYTLEELLEFLGMTEEEWNNITSGKKDEENKNICDSLVDPNEYECTPGDIKFDGFSEPYPKVESQVCDESSGQKNVKIEAKYSACECGKWVEQTPEILTTNGVKEGYSIKYTWTFNKTGEYRDISETITKRTKFDKCTTSIKIMVPEDLREENPSKYITCEEYKTKYKLEAVRIPTGGKYSTVTFRGGYTPKDATNRTLLWNSTGEAISLSSTKDYVSKKSYSKAIVTAEEVGNSNLIASATLDRKNIYNNQTDTCNISVWDGSVESLSCSNISLGRGDSGSIKTKYEPYNANKTNFTYTSSNTNVAIIDDKGKVTAKTPGTSTVTVKAPNGMSTQCSVTVKEKDTQSSYSYGGGGCSCTRKEQVNVKILKGKKWICDTYKKSCETKCTGFWIWKTCNTECVDTSICISGHWEQTITYVPIYENITYYSITQYTRYEGYSRGTYYCRIISKCQPLPDLICSASVSSC